MLKQMQMPLQASKVTAQGLQVAAVLGAVLTVFIWVAAPNLVAAMRGERPVTPVFGKMSAPLSSAKHSSMSS